MRVLHNIKNAKRFMGTATQEVFQVLLLLRLRPCVTGIMPELIGLERFSRVRSLSPLTILYRVPTFLHDV